jgi:hypothetical protein
LFLINKKWEGQNPFPARQWGQEKSGTDAVMHARQVCIQLVRQTEGQEKRHRCGDACQADMHSAGEANRGTGKET